jgi:hypothetical protein
MQDIERINELIEELSELGVEVYNGEGEIVLTNLTYDENNEVVFTEGEDDEDDDD